MTEITSRQLENLILQSQFGDKELVFTFRAQKQIAFRLAYDLVVAGEEPDKAIEIAKTFVHEFYQRVIKFGASVS